LIAFPKVAKAAATHPASTNFMGLIIGMLIMGIKSVGAKKMWTGPQRGSHKGSCLCRCQTHTNLEKEGLVTVLQRLEDPPPPSHLRGHATGLRFLWRDDLMKGGEVSVGILEQAEGFHFTHPRVDVFFHEAFLLGGQR
jgi:hypothetical protein